MFVKHIFTFHFKICFPSIYNEHWLILLRFLYSRQGHLECQWISLEEPLENIMLEKQSLEKGVVNVFLTTLYFRLPWREKYNFTNSFRCECGLFNSRIQDLKWVPYTYLVTQQEVVTCYNKSTSTNFIQFHKIAKVSTPYF